MASKDRVLQHLKDFGSITSWEAIREYGITRLSAVIFNLRKDYIIEDEYIQSVNRYGDNVHFKKYYLRGKNNGQNN